MRGLREETTVPELVPTSEFRWTIPQRGAMRVPGVVFASAQLLPGPIGDRSLLQVTAVATLPGIVGASYAMPDIHWGYGFPIGGVAATDVAEGGVISPGGVGFDISCGVRLLRSSLDQEKLQPLLARLMDGLSSRVPTGLGRGAVWEAGDRGLGAALREGAAAAVEAGYGLPQDLDHCEDGGRLAVGDLSKVSDRALERGLHQLGSLGSGNHFLEVQVVDRVLDARAAERFGLSLGQVTVMIHTGSRGLGHQICSDHVREMLQAMGGYGIEVPDPQLASAPVDSEHGRRYLSSMAAAANYGRANRQAITWGVRQEFEALVPDAGLEVVFDVSHNLAKIETHTVDGRPRLLCVHRKGATRALPPGHPDLPADYRDVGQPVFVPGSMGTASYVLVGHPENEAFNSTCHGAGRTMSRHAAMRTVRGRELVERLAAAGIVVSARSVRYLPEEAPAAYKDIDEVVRVCAGAKLSTPVVRLRPVGVLKG